MFNLSLCVSQVEGSELDPDPSQPGSKSRGEVSPQLLDFRSLLLEAVGELRLRRVRKAENGGPASAAHLLTLEEVSRLVRPHGGDGGQSVLRQQQERGGWGVAEVSGAKRGC